MVKYQPFGKWTHHTENIKNSPCTQHKYIPLPSEQCLFLSLQMDTPPLGSQWEKSSSSKWCTATPERYQWSPCYLLSCTTVSSAFKHTDLIYRRHLRNLALAHTESGQLSVQITQCCRTGRVAGTETQKCFCAAALQNNAWLISHPSNSGSCSLCNFSDLKMLTS